MVGMEEDLLAYREDKWDRTRNACQTSKVAITRVTRLLRSMPKNLWVVRLRTLVAILLGTRTTKPRVTNE